MSVMKSSKPPLPAPRNIQDGRPPLPARPRKERLNVNTSPDSVEPNQLANLKEFAERKNFTQSECNEAITRTTLLADTNYFLSQLIAVRAESSSTEPPGPKLREEPSLSGLRNSEGLRSVVIDGSNVAMT